MNQRRRSTWLSFGASIAGTAIVTCLIACLPSTPPTPKQPTLSTSLKTLHFPTLEGGPRSLDPIQATTKDESLVGLLLYETLLQYRFLASKPTLEPLLLAAMPSVDASGTLYSFTLRDDVYFKDDPCFSQKVGRKLTTDDIFYSLKRLASPQHGGKAWWLFKDTIAGLDHFHQQQIERHRQGLPANMNTSVSGFIKKGEHRFDIRLVSPDHRFLYTLAMVQSAIVPHEAVAHYRDRFHLHPVGTGPFELRQPSDFVPRQHIHLQRNRRYHHLTFPSITTKAASKFDFPISTQQAFGKKIPFLDRINISFVQPPRPRWLGFLTHDYHFTSVAAEYLKLAYQETNTSQLKSEFTAKGIRSVRVPMLDFIYHGFNMLDPTVGLSTPKNTALRQAIAAATDWHEINRDLYYHNAYVYCGPIPAGLAGHCTLTPNKEQPSARQWLSMAGYPEGKGLPPLHYYIPSGVQARSQADLWARQLQRVGIRLSIHQMPFVDLLRAVVQRKAQIFSLSWSSDYPDAENNFALFYGPNAAPGANRFNYSNPKFDKLYETIRHLPPSPRRTEKFAEMQRLLAHDRPFVGSLSRTRHYLYHDELLHFFPSETHYHWVKYLDLRMPSQAESQHSMSDF